uniref:Putative secreted protein n=1 Tax=Ixodes ricinus TaxID=34613 RepID=A0A6B0U4G7_IXORI
MLKQLLLLALLALRRFAFPLFRLLFLQVPILAAFKCICKQELTEALNRQKVKRAFTRLHQFCQPGHMRSSLPLNDVKQEVWVPAPAEQMAQLVSFI